MPHNPGPLLTGDRLGGENTIPPEFIAAMERHVDVQWNPTTTEPDPLSDTVVESEIATDRINERKRQTVKKKAGNITLSGIRHNESGQPVQVTLLMRPTTNTAGVPSATQQVAVKDLGNGWSIEETSVEGSYVNGVFTPGVFPQNLKDVRQAIVLPDKFKQSGAILTTESATTSGTTATTTALGSGGTGVIESKAQRVDLFKVRLEDTTLTASTNSSVTEYALRDGQLVTVATSYVADSATAPTVSATTEIIEREVIGGGKAIERVGNVSAVFPRNASGHKQMIVVPEKFRTGMTLTTTGVTSAGTTATPAVLGSGGTGVVESNAQRVDATKVRVETTTLSGSVDTAVGEYGYVEGLVAPIATTLVNDGDAASSGGLLVTNVQREVIGEGKAINKVETVASWPTRYGQDYNARFNVVIPWQETTIAPGASGTANTEIRPVDFARQRNRTYDFANITAAYAASVITFPGKFTVDLPNVLKKVEVKYNSSVGYGASNHPTSKQYVAWTNKGSYTVAPTSTSQGSASIIADVTYEIEYYQGISVDCEHHYFYLTSTATLAQVLTKTGAKSLPAFRPKSSQINVYGGQVSLQQSADSRISGSYEAYSSVAGDGFSTEVGVSSKVITIPPTIHGGLLVLGLAKKTATVTVSASANITRPFYQVKKGSTNGTPDFSVPPTQVGLFNTPSPRSETVEAGVTPTFLPATSPHSIPTSGKYLVACSGEPVDYGFTLIHAVVVDFAQYA